ncbi:N-formylglutamate amidohydrolase [Ruegeria sp. HKCCD7255]|uniref:N-formylglutamate amidohydrolase n=1 Tax=Ruegeria sp. HKCCD7255 TaxID=2683004 RepID=UPI001489C3BE|nr:N-formylglutamate amidohydrolase [Ruegeria sp. HKCCD7255]
MAQLESHHTKPGFGPVVFAEQSGEAPSVIVVCEHASNRVPEFLGDMGVGAEALRSHIAWDPGALPVARNMARQMSASLVFGGVSRLVYDCNRPPEAVDAMPARSEDVDVPVNAAMSSVDRVERVEQVYLPFSKTLSDEVKRNRTSLQLMVTVHSFTPVFKGQKRQVELGLLHGADSRFAAAMIAHAPAKLPYVTRLNEPYSAADGVAHTLDVQGLRNGLLNVMIEIRNDLIQTPTQQQAAADCLVPWIKTTLTALNAEDAS